MSRAHTHNRGPGHATTREVRLQEGWSLVRWWCTCGWSTEWVVPDSRAHEAASAAVLVHVRGAR